MRKPTMPFLKYIYHVVRKRSKRGKTAFVRQMTEDEVAHTNKLLSENKINYQL